MLTKEGAPLLYRHVVNDDLGTGESLFLYVEGNVKVFTGWVTNIDLCRAIGNTRPNQIFLNNVSLENSNAASEGLNS
jgi:hypothetical protein